MNYLTFVIVNGPLVFLNIAANAFYTFCLVCPCHGKKIKQPLKLLLLTMVSSTIAYLVSILGFLYVELQEEMNNVDEISLSVSIFTLTTSMNSSVWLNFFYYIQIVPAQRAFFIWIKRNIKVFVYYIWLAEKISSVLDFAAVILEFYPFDYYGSNDTLTRNNHIAMPEGTFVKWVDLMCLVLLFFLKAHLLFCVCVMVESSSATAIYLCKHMRRMVANGKPLSCPRFSSQVRVTITGILQGVLYVFCAVWIMCMFIQHQINRTQWCLYIHLTIINLYMSGTTLCLGAGQTVFRQRVADVWTRAAQWCKAPKVHQSEQKA